MVAAALLSSIVLNILFAFMLRDLEKHYRRESARERVGFQSTLKDLTDRIMYQADKPWTLPPRPVPTEEVEDTIIEEPGWEEV